MKSSVETVLRYMLAGGLSGLSQAHADADTSLLQETFNLSGFIFGCITFVILLSGIFLLCVKKIIQDKNSLNEKFHQVRKQNDELLDQKHLWLERESTLISANSELEKRITARTETVNKVNHDLTKSLEHIHNQKQRLNTLSTALNSTQRKVLIIDKHYHICFASQPFLNFTGLSLINIKDQPLKLLEKHVCLPEMASDGLAMNQHGLINTALKCLDKQGDTHWLNAQIALSWSEQKEISHYVIVFEENSSAKQTVVSRDVTGSTS